MSRVITFSRNFPSYHPRKGEPTFFIEGILTQLKIDYTSHDYFIWLCENNPQIGIDFLYKFQLNLSENIHPKSHTIRGHKRPINIGEFINPKCWAGKPYNKTKDGYWQIKFAPDIEIKKTFEFAAYKKGYYLNTKPIVGLKELSVIAKNDGLKSDDFELWFNKDFGGRILCWNENINY